MAPRAITKVLATSSVFKCLDVLKLLSDCGKNTVAFYSAYIKAESVLLRYYEDYFENYKLRRNAYNLRRYINYGKH